MPKPIKKAPNAETMKKGCRLMSSKCETRRVTPISPKM